MKSCLHSTCPKQISISTIEILVNTAFEVTHMLIQCISEVFVFVILTGLSKLNISLIKLLEFTDKTCHGLILKNIIL